MPLYRDYDRAALDAQYDNRARVPEHVGLSRQFADTSAITRGALECRLDLPYGDSPRERLDLFPAADAGAPVLAFIHGGYWQSRDKEDFSFLAPAFVEAGIAVAMIEYDLAPAVRVETIVDQCRQALLWLHRHAAGHGIDPDRIFVAGHSAGGHLTAMALADGWAAAGGGPADLVKGGCAISGLYDLEPIRLCYLNEVLGMDEEESARNSPVRLPPHEGARLVLAVGGAESEEYHRQQADMAAAWRAAGAEVAAIEMPGLNHFTILPEAARPGSPLFEAIVAMAKGGVKGGGTVRG